MFELRQLNYHAGEWAFVQLYTFCPCQSQVRTLIAFTEPLVKVLWRTEAVLSCQSTCGVSCQSSKSRRAFFFLHSARAFLRLGLGALFSPRFKRGFCSRHHRQRRRFAAEGPATSSRPRDTACTHFDVDISFSTVILSVVPMTSGNHSK